MNQPVRVLHFLKQLEPGGVETWLLNVLRNIDRERFQLDFLVQTDTPGVYDDEVKALGARVISCPGNPQSPAYAGQLYKAILQAGPYDVIHSHTYLFSGQVMRIAAGLGIPVRIAHTHTTRARSRQTGMMRRLYDTIMRRWINRYATDLICCSPAACELTFGFLPEADARVAVVPCGVDLSRFNVIASREEFRIQLGLPVDALVVGHVGSLSAPKNHDLLLQAFAQVLAQHPEAWLLLVGDGPRRGELEALAVELNIAHRVNFLGLRRDVPQVLQVMDVFVMPSTHEGVPVAAVEAQAAGLPCVFSEAVPADGIAVEAQIHRLSSSDSNSAWADAIIKMAGQFIPVEQAVEKVRVTPLALDYGINILERIYCSGSMR